MAIGLAVIDKTGTFLWGAQMTKIRALILASMLVPFPGFVHAQSQERPKEDWLRFFSQLKPEQVECVRVGLQHRNLKFESIDPTAQLEPLNSPAAKDVYARCDAFFAAPRAWVGKGTQEDYPCRLASGLSTRCLAEYAERMPDGRLRKISREAAIRLQMDDKPWTIGQRENDAAKQNRERVATEEQSKREVEESEKREAAEKERRWKESPEYRRQQADLDRKRAAEQKAAEEQDRKRAAEQKAAEEQERRRVAEQKVADEKRLVAQRAAEEKERQRVADQRVAEERSQTENELGANDIVQENPKRRPFYATGESKYWLCSGLVHENLIKRVFSGVAALEKMNGLSPSQMSTCLYHHMPISFGGQKVIMKTVNFYLSAEHQRCVLTNKCGDMRSVQFLWAAKPASISYTLTNKEGSQVYGACTALAEGKVLSPDKNCMAM